MQGGHVVTMSNRFSGAFRCLIEEKLLSGHAFMKLRLAEAAEL